VPIAPDSYSFYGEDLLPNFDALPTWAYATPHNIQLQTPQAETCDSCHGNADLFLTIDKVDPAEVEANRDIIVDQVPPPVDAYEQDATPVNTPVITNTTTITTTSTQSETD
jgi:hypothetical protein